MKKRNNRLKQIGYVAASLGGLLLTLNFTIFRGNDWGMELLILAVAVTLTGWWMIGMGKKRKNRKQ